MQNFVISAGFVTFWTWTINRIVDWRLHDLVKLIKSIAACREAPRTSHCPLSHWTGTTSHTRWSTRECTETHKRRKTTTKKFSMTNFKRMLLHITTHFHMAQLFPKTVSQMCPILVVHSNIIFTNQTYRSATIWFFDFLKSKSKSSQPTCFNTNQLSSSTHPPIINKNKS